MNLQQLRYLVATADHGTMTKAASECHVAQPALSRALRALERELGLVLFERRGRGVELSADGRLVVEHARRILADASTIDHLARTRAVADVLAIAATPTIQTDLGSGLISEYWRRHPRFPVRFVYCESREAVGEAVRTRRADVGVTDLPAGDDDGAGLVAVAFEQREVAVLAPPGTGLPDPLPIAALGDVPLILPTRGTRRRQEFDRMFADLGISPTVAFESDERASWVPAVLAGVGCCVWYRSMGDAGAAFGAEVSRLDPPLLRAVGVVHRREPLAPPAAALVDLARARAEGRLVSGTP